MKEKSIIAMCIGIPALIGLVIFAGWKIALCIFLLAWADNIDKYKKT